MVFVHGFLCRHQDWCHQMTHFGARHTVVACDLRGHGETPGGDALMTIEALGGDVAALIEGLDLRGAILVGHSMGCRVVMETCHQAAGRVAGLVLVDGSRVAVDCTSTLESFDAIVDQYGYAAVVRGQFEGMFFDDPPVWKDATLARVLAIPETTGRPLFRSLVAWDADKLQTAMTETKVPVLAVQSTTTDLNGTRRTLADDERG